jgi:hypothetical protein
LTGKRARVPERRRQVRKVFTVNAVWDADAGIYFSESDISGLHIEAESLEEFEKEMFEVAADLIVNNHMRDEDIYSPPSKDMIPAIVYRAIDKVA